MRLCASTLLVVLGLVTHAQGQDLPSWTAQHGAFAFPNEEGTRLLATAEIGKPEALRTALCAGGQRVAVRFERRQAEAKNFDGRHSPHNFANVAGTVFQVVGAKVDAGATCFLASDALLDGSTAVPLVPSGEGARCSRDRYPQFEQAKGRPVVACWRIAKSAMPGVQVVLVEFARRLNHALVSLAVIDQDRRLYVDYPATFNGPGADLWRADDGGEIHPEGFTIVFLLKRGSTYVLGIDWDGAEGAALSLWSADEGGQFDQLISASWYRSPL